MSLRRILAVLALATLTSLSPTIAQSRPAQAERTTAQVHSASLLDLLLDRLVQIRTKLLGTMNDSGSGNRPDGAKTDTGSSLDPDGAK